MLNRDSHPKGSSFNERFHLPLKEPSSIIISKAVFGLPKDSAAFQEKPLSTFGPDEEIKRLLSPETSSYQKAAIINSLRERLSIRAIYALYLGTFDENFEVRQKSADALLSSLKNLASLDPSLDRALMPFFSKLKNSLKDIRAAAISILDEMSSDGFSQCILHSINHHQKPAAQLALRIALIHYSGDNNLWHAIQNLALDSQPADPKKQSNHSNSTIWQNALIQKKVLADYSASQPTRERNPLKLIWTALRSHWDCRIRNPRKVAIELAWHFYGSHNLYNTKARINAANRLLNLHLKKGEVIGERLIKHFDNWVSIEDIFLKGLLDSNYEVKKTCAAAILKIKEKSDLCWQDCGVRRSPYLRSLLD